ncbi:hypothetical protein, partial [Cohnella sp. JJ-181]|uniref:hypothetical protein n=1 Tax=Cohnella rhizoplanae TaxID=2974897 RepID=UPI00232E3A6E
NKKVLSFLAPLGIGLLKLFLFKNVIIFSYFYLGNSSWGGNTILALELLIVFAFIIITMKKKKLKSR